VTRPIRDICLFFSPFFVVFGFPLIVLFRAGEFKGIDIPAVISSQIKSKDEFYYRPAYNNNDYLYKIVGTQKKIPKILVVGSSRSMQIRSIFFKNPGTFYNAGGSASKVSHLTCFLDQIPAGHEPKLLILTLDPEWFNGKYDNEGSLHYQQFLVPATGLGLISNNFVQIYKDNWHKKFTLHALFNAPSNCIGLNASINGNGFRRDGSYLYAKSIINPDEGLEPGHRFQDALNRIATGSDRFEFAETPAEWALENLASFLESAARRDIHVVAAITPYAPKVWRTMVDTRRYGYLGTLGHRLEPLFASFGFIFLDCSNPAKLTAQDSEFFDGFHPSERVAIRLLQTLARKDPYLSNELNHIILEGINAGGNPLYVFPQ